MDITIYRSLTKALINQIKLQQLLKLLPASLRPRALRYKSELSSYNYVIGRLLLKQGLEAFSLDNDLEKIEFQENGKPFLPNINFNISHSDYLVICGLSKEGEIGVDIEKISAIDFEDFISMFTVKEWTIINNADDPTWKFYWFWTRKESIIKALGQKLSYLHKIELDITSDHFVADGKQWFLEDLNIEDGYIGAICSENKIGKIDIIEVDF